MKKLVLCILDGFGLGDPNYKYNAVFKSHIPNLKRFLKKYPHSSITTSGASVGLPEGQMGNSEVGHITIGSGRVLMQDLPLITKAIETGSIRQMPEILHMTNILKEKNGALHILGLCSKGGVHSHISHIIAIANFFADKFEVFIHALSDGRDVNTDDFLKNLSEFQKSLHPKVKIVTLCGRFFTMDRDKKLERTAVGIDLIINAKGSKFKTLTEAVNSQYTNGKTDEFIEPCVIGNYDGVKENDILLFANFRADRAKQATAMMLERKAFAEIFTMMKYSQCNSIFKKTDVTNTLSEVISKNGLKQFKIAETEKYAHVTFFLNGGIEAPFDGEERLIIPSPKVTTYDLKPEMSLPEVEEKLLEKINIDQFDFLACNIANGDMVGHTGNFEAACKAMERIDEFLGKLEEACLKNNYTLFVTADHGNLEEMLDEKGNLHTQHTTSDVPLFVISKEDITLKDGTLADIAPTILNHMNLEVPKEMEGKNLIK